MAAGYLGIATRARQALEVLAPSLPNGVRVVTFDDRATLVRRVARTVQNYPLGGRASFLTNPIRGHYDGGLFARI